MAVSPAHAANELAADTHIPGSDPDIMLFMNSWKNAEPVITHGSLVEYPILTKTDGDPLEATVKGRVLTMRNRLSRTVLDAGTVTPETRLDGEQEVFYVLSGSGRFTAGGQSEAVRKGHFVAIPEKLPFTIAADTGADLVMYLMNEPIPDGGEPKTEMTVSDERERTRRAGSPTAHWWHNPRGGHGGFSMITFDPMAIGHPHSHPEGWEEVWLCVEGELTAMFGTQLYPHPPGIAYRIPPTGHTPHSDINVSDKPAKCLIFLRGKSSHADNDLEYQPLDPAVDPDIDMFVGDWRRSIPFNTLGTLTERTILSPLKGGPTAPVRVGAVLTATTGVSRATLEPRSRTVPSAISGEQAILAVVDGIGVISAGGETWTLRAGTYVLVPSGAEFFMENTGDTLLVMYVVREPVLAGFTPRGSVLVRNEGALTNWEPGYPADRWNSDGRLVFGKSDGLAALSAVTVLECLPGTMGRPHSRDAGDEEVWLTLAGENVALIGKEIRRIPAGAAYKVPPTGRTPHSDMNLSGETVKLLGLKTGE